MPQAIEIPIFVDELGFQVQGPRHFLGTLKNGPGDQVYANGPKSSRKHPKSDHFPRARRHPPETWFLGSRQGPKTGAARRAARSSQEQPGAARRATKYVFVFNVAWVWLLSLLGCLLAYFIWFACLLACLPWLFACLLDCLLVCLFACFLKYVFVLRCQSTVFLVFLACLFNCLTCLLVCLFACVIVCLLVCLFACLLDCLFV